MIHVRSWKTVKDFIFIVNCMRDYIKNYDVIYTSTRNSMIKSIILATANMIYNSYDIYIVELYGTPVGMIEACETVAEADDEICITNIYIQREYRSKGIMSYAVNDLKQFFKGMGLNRMNAPIFDQHWQVHPFYRNLGFRMTEYIIMGFWGQDLRKWTCDI